MCEFSEPPAPGSVVQYSVMPPKSIIWKYFSKVSEKLARCNLCLKTLKTSGNTTNLTGHLRAKHKDEFAKETIEPREEPPAAVPSTSSASLGTEISRRPQTSAIIQDQDATKMKLQKTVKESFLNITSFKHGGDMHSRVSQAILYMICKDSQPISVVEDEGFQNLLKVTAPLYSIPSRKTIDSLIDQKYETISAILKEQLLNIPYICLTTDIWTETYQTRSFLGLTAHFIENWNLESVILGVSELHDSHTAQNLADELLRMCSEWGCTPEKITAVVTDAGSNIVSAVEKAFGKKTQLLFRSLTKFNGPKIL